MPAYNAAEYIETAVVSILNQTHKNVELLIYNDGSTDQTNAICARIKQQDHRVRYFSSTENKGNLFATNFLFAHIVGEYLAIQDADDHCSPQKLELQLQAFHKNPNLVMVGTQFVKTDQHGKELFCGFLPQTNAEIKKTLERFFIPVLYASVLVKTNVLKRVGGFPDFFNRQGYADMDWLAKCALQGEVINLNQPLYFYREHPSSFSSGAHSAFFWTPYFDLLLVEAHKQRSKGLVDFLETSDTKQIRVFLSESLLNQAWEAFLVHQTAKGLKLLFKGISMNFFSRKTAANLFYGISGLYKYKRTHKEHRFSFL